MPILKKNKHRYPKDWKDIRSRILERAGNKCEFCGVRNHAIGHREDGLFYSIDDVQMTEHHVFMIVLTIAHLDHMPENNDPSNLKALCQQCHNRYDSKHRAETRRKNKHQLLFEGVEWTGVWPKLKSKQGVA